MEISTETGDDRLTSDREPPLSVDKLLDPNLALAGDGIEVILPATGEVLQVLSVRAQATRLMVVGRDRLQRRGRLFAYPDRHISGRIRDQLWDGDARWSLVPSYCRSMQVVV